ncbi:hypothetical protein CEXT_89751 [Caerostris extrusa]|uniref:Uncharacterized protein n=1 Tax=Caerostris extrusa TaxID=172846 RepID=A0AAV4YAG3_CAEEX|nr:hypothetical protein CEXT_89751 [Caerostris extrusa]
MQPLQRMPEFPKEESSTAKMDTTNPSTKAKNQDLPRRKFDKSPKFIRRLKRSYANIISNQNEQAHPSTISSSKLPKNPTEVDLFSTLLKLIHQEEVNGPSPTNSL